MGFLTGGVKVEQTPVPDYSRYDKEAKKRGFKSGDEMMNFYRQRQQGSKVEGSKFKLPSLSELLSWHPTYTLNRASDALREATER